MHIINLSKITTDKDTVALVTSMDFMSLTAGTTDQPRSKGDDITWEDALMEEDSMEDPFMLEDEPQELVF